jgi:hypothetical protein
MFLLCCCLGKTDLDPYLHYGNLLAHLEAKMETVRHLTVSQFHVTFCLFTSQRRIVG